MPARIKRDKGNGEKRDGNHCCETGRREREREMGLVTMEEKSTEEEEKQIKMEKSTVDVKGMEKTEEDL